MKYSIPSISIFGQEGRMQRLERRGHPLLRLAECVDFEMFRPVLEKGLDGWRDSSKGGRPPYDRVFMFKVLVLQHYYNLSDAATEEWIDDRETFRLFLGMTPHSTGPEASTIWKFRDQLQRKGLIDELFAQLNVHLIEQGIIVAEGQLVDATFVETPKQRNSSEETDAIKNGETPAAWKKNPHKLAQKDLDARWTKKNSVCFHGYKLHVVCDDKSKLVTDYDVTDAAVHDSVVLPDLIESGLASGQELYADSAYRSAGIEIMLAAEGVTSQVHERAYRGTPLTESQKAANKAKSRRRARVEHVFAHMTQSMGGLTAKARSLNRVAATLGLKTLVYNLDRATRSGHRIRFAEG